MGVRRKLIRSKVDELLAANDVAGAPVPVEQIARTLGAEIVASPPDDDSLSGFLLRERDNIIIGVNGQHPKNRQRFTIAHEIGHLLLHEGARLLVDSRHGFELQRRDGKASEGTDIIEREANWFAAELLMPESFLEKDLAGTQIVDILDPDEKVLKELARRYRVSIQALTFRLTNLGYIQ